MGRRKKSPKKIKKEEDEKNVLKDNGVKGRRKKKIRSPMAKVGMAFQGL